MLNRDRIPRDIDELTPSLRDVAAKIHAAPELRFEEHRAAAWLSDAAEAAGASVERGVGGMPTSFRARL